MSIRQNENPAPVRPICLRDGHAEPGVDLSDRTCPANFRNWFYAKEQGGYDERSGQAPCA
jgi:hypothetical protein